MSQRIEEYNLDNDEKSKLLTLRYDFEDFFEKFQKSWRMLKPRVLPEGAAKEKKLRRVLRTM